MLASSQHNLYDINLLLRVQCYTAEDGQINCPKHVHSYSKNKFGILVHLVGLIIRIYHNSRSSESKKSLQAIFSHFSLPHVGIKREVAK